MKQIRFLGILAILAFILEFVFSFQSAFSDFEEGLKDGMQRTEMEKKDRPSYMVKVNITPKDIKNKDAYIDSYNRNVTNTISQVRTYIKPSLASDLINVPVVLIVLPFAKWLIPTDRQTKQRPCDYLGSVQVLIGLVAAIYALKELSKTQPSLLLMLTSAALGIAFLTIFVRRQRRLDTPMIDFSLFSNQGRNSQCTNDSDNR